MKIIKKYTAIIMTALMLLCGKPVYAQEPQFGSATIEYTVEDSFMVHIPETMSIDEEASIFADQMNIDPSKSVRVYIAGFETSDGIYISNVNNPDSKLVVHFRDENGNALSQSNTLVGSFVEESTFLHLTPYIDSYTQEQTAGRYTGVVYFNIQCE